MAVHRPFPPSPRRRALAHQAGLHAASPLLVAATGGAAALVVLGGAGAALFARLGAAVAAAGASLAPLPRLGPRTAIAPLTLGALPDLVAGSILPLAGAAALAALAMHVAQTRALWLPRRRIRGAPTPEIDPAARTRRAAFELAAAAAIGGVAFAWLWFRAPHMAALVELDPSAAPVVAVPAIAPPAVPAMAPPAMPATLSQLLAGAAALLANLAVALVVAWLVCGVVDALLRRAALARTLAMTPAELREDIRLAGADPRWRAQRAAARRASESADGVARALLLVLGDSAAVAIAWDPPRRPVPVRTATGVGPIATQLLGLARRHRIAVHRDPALAAALVHGDGPVPESHWPRVAEIIAAVRGRAT